jgi:hypothetical protein
MANAQYDHSAEQTQALRVKEIEDAGAEKDRRDREAVAERAYADLQAQHAAWFKTLEATEYYNEDRDEAEEDADHAD